MKTRPVKTRIPKTNQRGIFKAEAVIKDDTVSGTLTLRNKQTWPAVIKGTKIRPIAKQMIGQQYTVMVSHAINRSLILCVIPDQLIGSDGKFTIMKVINSHHASGTFHTDSGTYNDAELRIPNQILTKTCCSKTYRAFATANENGTIVCTPAEALELSETEDHLAEKKGYILIEKFQNGKHKYGKGTLTVNHKTYKDVYVDGFKRRPYRAQYIGKSFEVVVNNYDSSLKAFICTLTDKRVVSITENKQNQPKKETQKQTETVGNSLNDLCVRKYLLLKENPEIGNCVTINRTDRGFNLSLTDDDPFLRGSIPAFFSRNSEIIKRMTDQLNAYTAEIEKQYTKSIKG